MDFDYYKKLYEKILNQNKQESYDFHLFTVSNIVTRKLSISTKNIFSSYSEHIEFYKIDNDADVLYELSNWGMDIRNYIVHYPNDIMLVDNITDELLAMTMFAANGNILYPAHKIPKKLNAIHNKVKLIYGQCT